MNEILLLIIAIAIGILVGSYSGNVLVDRFANKEMEEFDLEWRVHYMTLWTPRR